MTLDLSADYINVEDITDRVDELREERDGWVLGAPDGTEIPNPAGWATDNTGDAEELSMLEDVLDNLRGAGGDHQWEGDWYPQTLIARSAFVDYIKELIHDCYEVKESSDWPYRHMAMDYEAAADEAETDYSEVTVNGSDYLYR
jgi:hypothetical protein